MDTITKTDNELIAEFMGFERIENDRWMAHYIKGLLDPYFGSFRDVHLRFNESWDWLMPVVEKIERLGYYTTIFKDEDGQQTAILHPVPSYQRDENSMIVPNDPMRGNESKIDTTYSVVVEFIKWYNEQNHDSQNSA